MEERKKNELTRLRQLVEEYYGFSIMKRNRAREVVYAKKVFSQLGRDFGYAYQAIANEIGHNHATIIHHEKSFHAILDYDAKIYNKCSAVFAELIDNNKAQALSIEIGEITDVDVIKAKYELLVAELKTSIFEQKEEVKALREENKGFSNVKPILEYFEGWTDQNREEFINNRLRPYSLSLKHKIFN
jgi:hypothetical protein